MERALSLLALVSEQGRVSLTEAARATGLSPATSLRLLRTLETQEFVRRDPTGEYRPGVKTIRVGAQALSHEPVVAVGQPELDRIALQTGESAYLSIRGHGATALYVAIAEGTQMVRYVSWIGLTIPLKGTAAGRALDGRAEAGSFLCIPGDVDEHAVSIAAPVAGSGRLVEAAVSVVVPDYRADEASVSAIGALLLQSSGRIAAALELLGREKRDA